MNSQSPSWEPDFDLLEQRMNDLITLCTTLREENRGLRIKLQQTRTERDLLKEKNSFAIHSVESMLESVRVLEQQS
ncbi:MAG TPA: DUF904 domain-containing protein [Gammaproteobacteria bacterium]|jgi:uncharacterized protein (TIGR02449 family)|nr:DUF904 domain-containing protein [Gammaproteobacteria bacterium]MBT6479350.1 DUF904 domain-containing protein [Gammaproteobacteria bacterium]MBT6653772.1 DUF904 domain-containing protein [Gammaproteobacteria bacterium]HIJ35384.1 DUF904 domain-containing protein [Gammaproteobacteria bacterium]